MKSGLEITTNIGCVNSCSYCPQAKLTREYSKRSDIDILSLESFRTIVDKLPGDTTLYFSGFSEPFLNRDCAKMIAYAEGKGLDIQVYTTLIGLDKRIIDEIKDLDLKHFSIHLPDDNGLTEIAVDDGYLENLDYLIRSRLSNISFHHHRQNGEIHSKIVPVLVRHDISVDREVRTWDLTTRAGNLEPRSNLSGPSALCKRLRRNVLLPNGDVALCCMDFGLKHVIGNLLESDYASLFRSEAFMDITSRLQDEDPGILCRNCELMGRESL
jgi:sulfatase maturation enzyme AslB (radical SAM superfamily)